MTLKNLALYLLILFMEAGCVTHQLPSLSSSNRLSSLDRAQLNAFSWVLKFIQKDSNFNYIFSDLIVMLNEMALGKPQHKKVSSLLQKKAQRLIVKNFRRAALNLDIIFEKTPSSYWEFVSIIPYLYKYNIDKEPFLSFYKAIYSSSYQPYYKTSFRDALSTLNWDVLGDYLIDHSFLELIKKYEKKLLFQLPESYFYKMIKSVKLPPLEGEMWDRGYFLTHLVFAFSFYGERKIVADPFILKLESLLIKELPHIIEEMEDLDLLAEYVHALILLSFSHCERVKPWILFLVKKQHDDGSWGELEDFEGDPYDQFHPTWAVLTALNAYGKKCGGIVKRSI